MTDAEYVYRVVDKDGNHQGSGGSGRRVFMRTNQATALKNRLNRWWGKGADHPSRYRVQRSALVWEDLPD